MFQKKRLAQVTIITNDLIVRSITRNNKEYVVCLCVSHFIFYYSLNSKWQVFVDFIINTYANDKILTSAVLWGSLRHIHTQLQKAVGGLRDKDMSSEYHRQKNYCLTVSTGHSLYKYNSAILSWFVKHDLQNCSLSPLHYI